MNKILYPLIATALITITPFLITFERGQDIVRGLFDYSVLVVLLFFVYVKECMVAKYKAFVLLLFGLVLFCIAVLDLQNVLACKGWNMGWRWLIPLLTCLVAVVMMSPVKAMSLNNISAFLFLSLMLHFGMLHFFPEQAFFEFPVATYLVRKAPNPDWPRNNLTPKFRKENNAIDSVSITRYYVDTTRRNVVVLVESWGIPMDSSMFARELAIFDESIKDHGIHFRMYSRTRTAEREDLLDSALRDSTGRRDSLFMPKRFAELDYTTIFLFGGDSTIQWRYKYIKDIGFQNAIWVDSAAADVVMAAKIDSLLSPSDSVKQFIAWTTRDTHFPISEDPVETEKLYYERLFETLRIIADLAKKHPDVRFVVQGDHEPILSPLEFQRKFYRRWVPYVVLN